MSVVMALFGLFWCLRRSSLGRCRHRMAGLRCLARTLASVSLVIVASTSMLSTILVALMGTCTKVLRSGAAISTPHCTGVSQPLILCLLMGIRITYLGRLAGLG